MSSIILEARDLRYHYPRGDEVIRGISFHIRRGEKIAIVGPNGAGKSTLLMMFNGMLRPDAGTMLYNGRPIDYDSRSLRVSERASASSSRIPTSRSWPRPSTRTWDSVRPTWDSQRTR